MSVFITDCSLVSCLGDLDETVAGLFANRAMAREVVHSSPLAMRVTHGYPIGDVPAIEAWPLVEPHIERVCRTLAADDLTNTTVLVGTGMGQQRAIEENVLEPRADRPRRSLFPDAIVIRSIDGADVEVPVITLTGACSASGTALALAQDMLTQHLATHVVVAGVDVMSLGMLGMMGRVNPRPPQALTPFDVDSGGVLLGEGAGAVLVTGEPLAHRGAVELVGTSITCDAYHETAPDPDGVRNAVELAHRRAQIQADEVDLVVAHATGTALNDPTEAAVLSSVFASHHPPVVAVKGATGHTSGASMVMSVAIAIALLESRRVPAIVGLTSPIEPAKDLNFPPDDGIDLASGRNLIAQVEAFGFGGANAVCILRTMEGAHEIA